MKNWIILPNGNLLNLDKIDHIDIGENKVYFYTASNYHCAEKTPEMIELLKNLVSEDD